jgi:uncharacterized protein
VDDDGDHAAGTSYGQGARASARGDFCQAGSGFAPYSADAPNKNINSGRIADSFVEWHLDGEDQACLVPVSDWPMRALVREQYRPYHDREILQSETELVSAILAEIDVRGPLSSLEFEDRRRIVEYASWAGMTRTKRILRSLWASGGLVTHHRQGGRHYYDRPERVIPAPYVQAQALRDEEEYHRWLLMRRHQSMGLMPKTAEACIWSGCGGSTQMRAALAQLVEAGVLTPVLVGEKRVTYHVLTSNLHLLDTPSLPPRMIFLGPLDSMLWDRKTVRYIFDFDYIWEVYKPEPLRKWGYYVLPVFYGDRFVARFDSRLEKGVWTLARWWWEPDVVVDAEMVEALREAVQRFVGYLRAEEVQVGEEVDEVVREAIICDIHHNFRISKKGSVAKMLVE